MRKLFYLCSLLALSFSSISNAQDSKNSRPEVAQYCKVYVNNENLQITTVRVGKPENNEILIEVFGIDYPFDKKIFKAKVLEYNTSIDITIQYEGKDWVIMTKRGSEGWNDNFSVYLPNKGKKPSEFTIIYSKDLSNQCKPEFLLTAFLEQKK
jgi:hypothetical protein